MTPTAAPKRTEQRTQVWSAVLIALITALVTLGGCTDVPDPSPPPDAPSVGLVRLQLEDPERRAWLGAGQRPLVTTLWYPAREGSAMELIAFPGDRPVFVGGHAARDAPVQPGGPRPLVLLSHGTGGSAYQMMWLGRRLAARGWLAAAVDHHGNTAAESEYDPRGFRMPWERARDLSAVLDQLLAHPEWGPRIDGQRIAAAGFSLGGYAVTALAGGVTDLDRLASFCAGPARDATCDPQPEYPDAGPVFEAMVADDPSLREQMEARLRADYRDRRVGAFVALAPALVQAFTPDSLAAIDRPVLIIAGGEDHSAPPATNAQPLARLIPGAQEHVLGGVDHHAFLDPCTAHGRRWVPVCRGREQQVIDELHEVTAQRINAFLAVVLRD